MLTNILKSRILALSLALFFFLVYLFTRTFMGVYLIKFRIGELAILFSLIVLIFSLIFYKRVNHLNKLLNSKIYFLNVLIIASFFLLVFISKGSLLNTYTFKSSTYIWTIGFFYLGMFVFEKNKISKKFSGIFVFLLIYIYFYNIYGIPDSVQSIFLLFSDKFEYHKGSDLLVMFVASFFVFNKVLSNKRIALEIFLIFTSLYFPLLLYKSRGAFIGFCIFVILELIFFNKVIKADIKRNILLLSIMIIVLTQSVFVVTKSGYIQIDEIDEKMTQVATYRLPPKHEENFRYLFVEDSRLYSSDSNINWRLQIWQDVIADMSKENNFLQGYGYNSKIPAMENPYRKGDDGTNENIHNYFLNIMARGGLIHLSLFSFFFYYVLKRNVLITKNFGILSLFIPLMFASFFDASMENSHYPLIFYFLLGMHFQSEKIFE